ncbi:MULTISPECIES: esterase/lipase family protein [unclassified Ornithinimicrobium]|uniref:esterase/lipase family protein n=1 Tax=unclassified Ornithinimicrobium TaxID=2615080 RepID=UPI003851B184
MNDVRTRPLILVRGFGGLDIGSEQANAYQGFNEGTVYPGRRGDNYIYEGFLLRALKSTSYRYTDATNVVGYYSSAVTSPGGDLDGWEETETSGTVVIDHQVARRVLREAAAGTLWVYRFYDLSPRSLQRYGEGLVQVIGLIRKAVERDEAGSFDGVDLVCHSMGGLVMREALLAMHKDAPGSAAELVHRVVTLGTPHRGIAFQRMPRWLVDSLPGAKAGSDELESFSPESTRFLELEKAFPVERILTLVGTNYRSYGVGPASVLNRLSSLFDEGTLATNRSDGLVKHSAAQLPGAPRTFVHKSHGGPDSVVNSRETYEIAMRFLHGTHKVSLWLEGAKITRGKDWFGNSEFYFGVSIKPRYVDFELFHQSAEAENCYGPFAKDDLSDDLPDLATELRKPLAEPGDRTSGWAGPDRLVWEGWVDAGAKPSDSAPGMVFRLDVYVGERDVNGIGFSDNVIFRKQYYVQAFPGVDAEFFLHTGEKYLVGRNARGVEELREVAAAEAHLGTKASVQRLPEIRTRPGWYLDVDGTGFSGRMRVAIAANRQG